MHAVIDRFEGSFVVVELPDRKMINIERKRVPQDAKEGDVLCIEGGKIYIDHEETLKRKAEIQKLTEDMWQ